MAKVGSETHDHSSIPPCQHARGKQCSNASLWNGMECLRKSEDVFLNWQSSIMLTGAMTIRFSLEELNSDLRFLNPAANSGPMPTPRPAWTRSENK